MATSPLNIHVLYESSHAGIPHGCSEIRLLRPLSHPLLAEDICLSYGLELPERSLDVVIIERLWDQSCSIDLLRATLQRLRRDNTFIIFEMDDDLLSCNSRPGDRGVPTRDQKLWLRYMMRNADGVVVSTANLAARVEKLNRNVAVVPNSLDERLFSASRTLVDSRNGFEPVAGDSLKFGYMGTMTHVEDLFSIIAPLRRVLSRHRSCLELEIVGIGDSKLIDSAFEGLPVGMLQVPYKATNYPEFALWMQEHLQWAFGVAPLLDSKFSQSKSDIKYLDYAVQGIPGIFSRVPAYQATVRHADNGLLATTVAEWEECLELMISDQELRLNIARNAHQDVWQTRMLETTACRWLEAVRQIMSAANLPNMAMLRG